MLERLYIEATENMPRVVLDEKEGKFMLSGRSLPENTEKAYRPIIDWITRYVENPLKETGGAAFRVPRSSQNARFSESPRPDRGP